MSGHKCQWTQRFFKSGSQRAGVEMPETVDHPVNFKFVMLWDSTNNEYKLTLMKLSEYKLILLKRDEQKSQTNEITDPEKTSNQIADPIKATNEETDDKISTNENTDKKHMTNDVTDPQKITNEDMVKGDTDTSGVASESSTPPSLHTCTEGTIQQIKSPPMTLTFFLNPSHTCVTQERIASGNSKEICHEISFPRNVLIKRASNIKKMKTHNYLYYQESFFD